MAVPARTGILLLGIIATLCAYEPSMLTLATPADAPQWRAIDISVAHRFYGKLIDKPLSNFLGIRSGAQVDIGVRYFLWNGIAAGVGIVPDFRQVSLDASWSYHFTRLPLSIVAEGEYITFARRPFANDEQRVHQAFACLGVQSVPLFKRIWPAVNLYYDTHAKQISGSIGVLAAILSPLDIFGEYYPVFVPTTPVHHNWLAGVKIKTYRHHFFFFVGSGSDMNRFRLMAGSPSPAVTLGFAIRRRIEWQ
jgi:hypothetical protein